MDLNLVLQFPMQEALDCHFWRLNGKRQFNVDKYIDHSCFSRQILILDTLLVFLCCVVCDDRRR